MLITTPWALTFEDLMFNKCVWDIRQIKNLMSSVRFSVWDHTATAVACLVAQKSFGYFDLAYLQGNCSPGSYWQPFLGNPSVFRQRKLLLISSFLWIISVFDWLPYWGHKCLEKTIGVWWTVTVNEAFQSTQWQLEDTFYHQRRFNGHIWELKPSSTLAMMFLVAPCFDRCLIEPESNRASVYKRLIVLLPIGDFSFSLAHRRFPSWPTRDLIAWKGKSSVI